MSGVDERADVPRPGMLVRREPMVHGREVRLRCTR